jgi:ribosome-associated protein
MTNHSDRLLQTVVIAATDKKAMNVVALHLQEISLIADYFVICHGNSDTQVLAIANEIRKQTEASGARIRGIEGLDTARWVLIDLGDVVVHVFHREEREYYHLERLWSDAKTIEFV